MRSGSKNAFQYHWILQVLTSILLLIGVGIGLIRAHKLSSFHHWVGSIMAVCCLFQIMLGWRHHGLFMQIQRRQWASYGHLYLDAVALGLISAHAVVLIAWVLVAARQHTHQPQLEEESPLYALQPAREDYFTVAVEDDNDIESRSSRDESQPVTISKKDVE
ncbi:uncharacterized protein BJX67DRAFT_384916 [Aspergillus lucknowensis]|uniref:Cytochrome b561 domain-containing protein n=1 Tax=Aspergillus lucknowensis TaxID=176173 RepID=A0ABR4LF60_9EURO